MRRLWFSSRRADHCFDLPPEALATEEARQKARSQVTTLFLYPRVGGKGVLLAKPIYNCYRMLNHLGTNRLDVSGCWFGDAVHAIATISDDQEKVAVLVYRHNPANTGADGPPERVQLTIKDLPQAGRVTVTHYAIDSQHSDVFAAWEVLGRPDKTSLTATQLNQILQVSLPDEIPSDLPIHGFQWASAVPALLSADSRVVVFRLGYRVPEPAPQGEFTWQRKSIVSVVEGSWNNRCSPRGPASRPV